MTTVLVVEDHGVVRAGLSFLLNAEEDIHVAAMAENGTQALALLASGIKIDVLLTDLHLSDMTGIELAQTFSKRSPEIKIIMLTVEAGQGYVSQAFRSGVKGYLLKEAGADELVYGIRKVSEGRYFICSGLTDRLSKRLSHDAAYTRSTEADIELSKREAEILNLLADGYTNLEIADRLFTSRRTVEGHRQSLLNKAGVRNTPELIKYAMLHGLIQIPVVN